MTHNGLKVLTKLNLEHIANVEGEDVALDIIKYLILDNNADEPEADLISDVTDFIEEL